MKNLRALGLLLLALLFGLAAAVYAAGWLSSHSGIASNRIVVAAVDVQLGSKIEPHMLVTTAWPAGSVPAGAFTEVGQLHERVVKTTILRGEPVVDGKLAPVGTRGGLSAVIAEGKRAITVRVNDVVGVAGFALPGNYVDVMVNTQKPGGGRGEEDRQISKTVLEHVLVLAVAQEANRDETRPKVVNAVTLEVRPEEAEKLDLARSVGTLSLVLRNQIDKGPVATGGVTKRQLFGDEPPVPVRTVRTAPRTAAAPRATGPCVEVIQNGTRTLNCF